MSSRYLPGKLLPNNAIPVTEMARQKSYNAFGYRCSEFDLRSDLNIVTLGCEWMSPPETGLSASAVCCKLLSEKYQASITDWNMALPGRSSDTIARTLLSSLNVLRPDAVLLSLPDPGRREYFRNDGQLIHYRSEWVAAERSKDREWKSLGAVDQLLAHHLNLLSSPLEDSVHLLKNYKVISSLLDERGIPWCFAVPPIEKLKRMVQSLIQIGWIDSNRQINSDTAFLDNPASEESHRKVGIELYRWLSEHADGVLRQRAAAGGFGGSSLGTTSNIGPASIY